MRCEGDLIAAQGLRLAVGSDPRAGQVRRAVLLAGAKEHDLFTTVQMQREPVPARLVGAQRLAAPLAIQPRRAADGVGLPVDLQRTVGLKKRLTVVIRRLPFCGFAAEALLTLQHQWPIGGEVQLIGEVFVASAEL